MTCSYCRAENASGDIRCCRCGRRFSAGPSAVQNTGALLAYEPEPIEQEAPRESARLYVVPPPGQAPETEQPRDSYQPSLFGPMVVVRHDSAPEPHSRPSPRQKAKRPAAGIQQELELLEHASVPGARTLNSSVQASVQTSCRIAPAAQRVKAGAIDLGITLGGAVVFFWVLGLCGLPIPFTQQTAPWLAGLTFLISLFYRLLFVLAGQDTPGLQVTGLRLVDFYGQAPCMSQRLARVGGGTVSLLSVGIGFLWSMVEEEHLAWHDHMSRTFPTSQTRA